MWKEFHRAEDELRGELDASQTEVVRLRLLCQQLEEQRLDVPA
jgi:hypothetical protein